MAIIVLHQIAPGKYGVGLLPRQASLVIRRHVIAVYVNAEPAKREVHKLARVEADVYSTPFL